MRNACFRVGRGPYSTLASEQLCPLGLATTHRYHTESLNSQSKEFFNIRLTIQCMQNTSHLCALETYTPWPRPFSDPPPPSPPPFPPPPQMPVSYLPLDLCKGYTAGTGCLWYNSAVIARDQCIRAGCSGLASMQDIEAANYTIGNRTTQGLCEAGWMDDWGTWDPFMVGTKDPSSPKCDNPHNWTLPGALPRLNYSAGYGAYCTNCPVCYKSPPSQGCVNN